jgi:hypothetical protein
MTFTSNISPRQNDVLEFPAFLKSGFKPLKVWAERGMVCFDDDNKESLDYLDPSEALQRVVTLITSYSKANAATMKEFKVNRSVLLRFADDFKEKVYEKALSQRCNTDGRATRLKIIVPY